MTVHYLETMPEAAAEWDDTVICFCTSNQSLDSNQWRHRGVPGARIRFNSVCNIGACDELPHANSGGGGGANAEFTNVVADRLVRKSAAMLFDMRPPCHLAQS